jgi:hypothetical protein
MDVQERADAIADVVERRDRAEVIEPLAAPYL